MAQTCIDEPLGASQVQVEDVLTEAIVSSSRSRKTSFMEPYLKWRWCGPPIAALGNLTYPGRLFFFPTTYSYQSTRYVGDTPTSGNSRSASGFEGTREWKQSIVSIVSRTVV